MKSCLFNSEQTISVSESRLKINYGHKVLIFYIVSVIRFASFNSLTENASILTLAVYF